MSPARETIFTHDEGFFMVCKTSKIDIISKIFDDNTSLRIEDKINNCFIHNKLLLFCQKKCFMKFG
jgi:hypothetical protein